MLHKCQDYALSSLNGDSPEGGITLQTHGLLYLCNALVNPVRMTQGIQLQLLFLHEKLISQMFAVRQHTNPISHQRGVYNAWSATQGSQLLITGLFSGKGA